MRRIKSIAVATTIIIILTILFGCGSATPDGSTATSGSKTETMSSGITVIDMMGRTIELDAPANKVVVLTASNCEIIFALGAQETIIGRGEYCDYPQAALNIPSIQSGENTNIEQVIALEPDLVIMSTLAQTEEQISVIEAAGIPVMVSDAQDIEGVYQCIAMIASALDKETEATTLIANMKERFAAIEKKAAEAAAQTKPTIYFEVSPLEYGLWTAGHNTFMDELAQLLGFENIFSDVDGWSEISQEEIVNRNPDYIVTVTMYYGEGLSPEDEIMARNGWQDITAVINQAVYPADSDEITRPGPRLADAAERLYSLIYA